MDEKERDSLVLGLQGIYKILPLLHVIPEGDEVAYNEVSPDLETESEQDDPKQNSEQDSDVLIEQENTKSGQDSDVIIKDNDIR